MKKYYGILCLLVLSVLSCSEYDDSELWDYVKEMNTRLTTLEEKCKEMNTNLSSLQTIVGAVENGDYITNMAPVTKDGKTIGYTITFHKSGTITIYNGTDGKDGKDGTNGINGTNGQDGYSPVIGVRKFTDGLYYWTIDGEWLLDNDGNKVRASGIDGKNGANGTNGINGTNGTNGENGVTPQLKIENEYWYVSYNMGETWQMLGKATGEKGDEGESLFSSVEVGDSEVIFLLSNGTSFVIPLQASSSEAEDTYEPIDLGLTSGTKWANKNLGARTECDYGDYYFWAHTSPYFINNDENFGDYINYKYSNKNELDLVDDAAHVELGSGWQIPNIEQATELCNECSFRATSIMGVYGIEVLGKNGNKIFLPATGYFNYNKDEPRCEIGYSGYYYISTRGRKESSGYKRNCIVFQWIEGRAYVSEGGLESVLMYTIRPVYTE